MGGVTATILFDGLFLAMSTSSRKWYVRTGSVVQFFAKCPQLRTATAKPIPFNRSLYRLSKLESVW
jgi:hypothetical protein